MEFTTTTEIQIKSRKTCNICLFLTGDGIDGVAVGLFKFSGGDDGSLVVPAFTELTLYLESNNAFRELFDLLHKSKQKLRN